jgi:asparagine synthase (glutamine-hydrolysing)
MLEQTYCGYFAEAPDRLKSWTDRLETTGHVRLEASGLVTTPAAGEETCILIRDVDTCAIEVDGEPVVGVLRGAPCDLDAGKGSSTKHIGIEEIARRAARHGAECLPGFGGSFSLALVFPRRREALLAIDRFALENLYYIPDSHGIAFGNRTQLLADHPACAQSFSAQAIYDYLYFHCLPGPDTGYAAIERVLPGQFVQWHDGKTNVQSYWRPQYAENNDATEDAIAEELRTAMGNAVARHAAGKGVGCFLSGGLDSSTVTGMSAAAGKGKITAFTIGFDAPEYDEMNFARAAADHFGVPLVPYYVTPDDVAASLPEIIKAFDGPFGNASAVPTYYCAKLAADHGMSVILAGDGGDELFGGNERYAKQLVFEKYMALPARLRESVLEPIVDRTPAWLSNKGTRYIEQAAIPLPDRLMTYNLLEMVGAKSFLTEEFLASIDTRNPARSLRSMYSTDDTISTLNRMLYLDLRITLADSDLPKVSRMCDLAGIRVAYPMLDEKLFDLAARLPSRLKIRRGELRYLFKRTFAGLLPASTLNKSKHGFGLPFGVWLQTDPKLQELVAANLSVLEDAGILRRDFRGAFLSAKFQEHPGYYGTLVWVLTCLGLWLRQQNVGLR